MTDVAKVKDLDFTELYLGHPSLDDRYSDAQGTHSCAIPAGSELRSDIVRLTALCRETWASKQAVPEFKIAHDGVAYRVSVIPAVSGTVFALRRIAGSIYSLSELGIPQAYIHQLMSRKLSGLLIVAGAERSGKTMTACALVKERLLAHGGVAVTGERPIELPLEGNYGNGVCFQTSIPDEDGFADAFRGLVRSGARTVLIGEVSHPLAAAEILQASMDGKLIVVTMVADSLIQAISKLHMLAELQLANGSAQSLMAEGLAGVFHQRIVHGTTRKFMMEFLSFREAPALKTILRSGKYDMLESGIKQQLASMITESAALHKIVPV